jgi:hypothetical protein
MGQSATAIIAFGVAFEGGHEFPWDNNSGGTPHNQGELDRISKMIEDTGDEEFI